MPESERNMKDDQRKQFEAQLRDMITAAVGAGLVDVTNASKAFENRIAAFEARQTEFESRFRTHSVPGAETATHKGEGYSFGKVFRALLTGNFEKDAPLENEMSRQLFAMGTAPDSSGGFLVPTEVFEDQIIPLLRPQVIAMELGITPLPIMGAGAIEIPRETTGPVVDAVAENQANSDSDMAFGNMRLEGHCAQSFIKASRKFLSLGAGADSFIRNRMAQELALKWNQWILKGTGSNGEPIGVLNAAGINTVAFTSAISGGIVTPLFYKKLLAMEDALADANALNGAQSLGWAVANRVIRAARQIASDNNSAGTANLEMDRKIFTAGPEEMMLGYRYRRTTQLAQGATTEAIFGDWSKVILATWNNLTIEASNTANDALQKRQTHIVAYMDIDVGVTQPTAFCAATALDTSSL